MPNDAESKSERTRREILDKAIDLASVEGLEGLTVGRLAKAAFLSKSGLFAHFGCKEELQLAVVERARELFSREVLAQAHGERPGLTRLLSLSSAWVGHLERGLLRGGCFFASASCEMDDRPGRVRDRLVELTRTWVEQLRAEAGEAIEAGELLPHSDPALLAFEIHAFVQEANWLFQLHGEGDAFRLARRAIRRSLRSVASESGQEILKQAGADS